MMTSSSMNMELCAKNKNVLPTTIHSLFCLVPSLEPNAALLVVYRSDLLGPIYHPAICRSACLSNSDSDSNLAAMLCPNDPDVMVAPTAVFVDCSNLNANSIDSMFLFHHGSIVDLDLDFLVDPTVLVMGHDMLCLTNEFGTD